MYMQVRAEVEQKSGRHFPEYTAVQFCSQVVAGMNFFIKVQQHMNCYNSCNILFFIVWSVHVCMYLCRF